MLLMIDNYDSFTYNLVQYLSEIGEEVVVYRNDEITIKQISDLNPHRIVISPGPCTPNEAGISLATIQEFAGKIPILGVCLGHQCIGQVFGGKIIRAQTVMHGKVSFVHHQNEGVFKQLPNPFRATRYHSLVVEEKSLPSCLKVTAWTKNPDGSFEEIMGLKHQEMLVEGVQFHPESILTTHGIDILKNFLNTALSK